MKKRSLIVFFIIAIAVVEFLTTVVVASLSDLSTLIGTKNTHIGEVFTLSHRTLTSGNSAYCIQKDKSLKSTREYSFILKHYVEINGKEALIYDSSSSSSEPDVVVDDINAQIAYILNRKQGYGSHTDPTDSQMALWYLSNSWTTTLFGNETYSWYKNTTAVRNRLNEDAETYASIVGNQKASDNNQTVAPVTIGVTDKTNKSNLSVMNVDEYYRVGPFRWEFDGVLKEIIVTGDVGTISNSNIRLVKYAGTTPSIVNASNISTGEAFYIDINKNSGITRLTGLKLKTASSTDTIKVYTAKIWFFYASSCQNLIYVDVGDSDVQPSNGEGTAEYDINFNTSLGLVKVDDRNTSIRLSNVGFTFSAQVETYDVVASTNHYVDVDCTHIIREAYTDRFGVYHPEVYEHETDRVVDWTQYTYRWVEHTMYLDNNNTWNTAENAKIFYTDNMGQISVDTIKYPRKTITNETAKGSSTTSTARLKAGTTSVTATEVSNPYYGYTTGNTYAININNNTELEYRTITNHQKSVKLSGYVWIDGNAEKQTIRNDEHNYGEAGFDGVPVYLKDLAGNVVKSTVTSELGLYSEIQGGEYQFAEVNLDELQAGKYYVEFEYCGITYQSVNPKLNQNNGSKAIDTATRNVLDSKFTSVDGNGTQSLRMHDVTVNYNGTQNYSNTIKDHTGCNVYARTNEAGYNLYSGFTPTNEEIRYVNLGLFVKAQTDFALSQDLYDVRVDVNGFSHIYKYAKVRYNDDGTIDEDSSWNVGVKFQRNTGAYDRAIYTADAEYQAPNHKDNELKVFVTYKMALRNESSYLGRINNIVDYCDSRYNLVSAGTSIDEKDNITGNISFGEKTSYNDKYSKYIINVNSTINASETNYIYVQYELNREAVLTIINNGDLINNIAEINSYTTFKNNDTNLPVAVIDKDSVPGNAIPGNIDTYEDDTDAARSLKLELRNARALTGTVFVDSTGKDSDKVYTEQERIGNGILDNNETTLSGIKVTMMEIGKEDSSYDGERIKMETTTDGNGNFEFVGYIPGNYTVTYTWGDKTYKVQYYKGTIYDESRNQNDRFWYKTDIDTRKTDALDSAYIRTKIDDEMETLKYNTLENEINKAYNGGSTYITQTIMNSTTPVMSFGVEYDTTITDGTVEQVRFAVKNIDFGIVERPKQQLDLTKRVSGFKITLANGQILVDATVTEDGRLQGQYDNTTYMNPTKLNNIDVNGWIRTELDNELIEGATLEITYTIKVKNVGELDYSSDRYYYYGNKSGSDSVRVSVTELVDYVDKRLSIVDDKWEEKDVTYLNQVNARQRDNETYLNSTRTYLTSKLSKALAPGESNTVNLYTSKLLTSTDDNTFENQVEITEVTKSEAFNTGTPVKIIWSDEKFHFNVANAETAIIIPSTGENRGYVLPIMIEITTLVVLSVGIVVIKKFIVDNK